MKLKWCFCTSLGVFESPFENELPPQPNSIVTMDDETYEAFKAWVLKRLPENYLDSNGIHDTWLYVAGKYYMEGTIKLMCRSMTTSAWEAMLGLNSKGIGRREVVDKQVQK